MSKETIKVVEINTDPAKKSIKDLRKELKGFKDQMANLEEGSDEFLEIANKAGELKHQLDEINKVVGIAAYEFDDYAVKIGGVATGLSGAFTAVSGALNLFGKESEAIEKAILKMQSLMAITQGLSTIPQAINDLEDLRKSITSTTGAAKLLKSVLQPKIFLAISAAVAGLSIVFGKYKEKQEEAIRIQEEYNKKIAEENRLRTESKVQEYLRNLSTELRIKEAIASVNYGDDELAYNKEMLKEYSTELTRAGLELRNIISIGRNSSSWETIGTTYDIEYNKWKEYYEQLRELVEQTEADIKVLEAKANALSKKPTKNPDYGIDLQGDLALLEVEPLEQSADELGARIGLILAQAEIKARNAKWKEEVENIENSGNQIFEGLKETMGAFGDSSLGLTAGWIASLDQFQLAFQQTMDIVKDEGTVGWEAYGNVAATALGGIGTMLNALSQEQDVSTKEGFEQQKKLQIAATTMNMLSGAMAAWTSAMALPAPASFIVGGIQSAAALALGAAQIAKIKSQTMESATASGAIQPTAMNSMIMPPMQYSNAVQGAELNGNIQNQRVWVAESDIEGTINKVVVQEQENIY